MQRAFWRPLLLAAVVAASGCDNDVGNTPTEPPPTVIDTFTGTVNLNGGVTHTFNVAANGTVIATLTTVTPDSTIPLGFGIGTWNNSSQTCTMTIVKDDALQGQIHTGIASGLGTLCARIYDAGSRLTQALEYSIRVEHP